MAAIQLKIMNRIQQHLQQYSTSTIVLRVYLTITAILYGTGGFLFLLNTSNLQITESAASIVSSHLAIVLWGWTETCVALLQIVCLLSRHPQVWRIATTMTVAWATAWAATVTYVAIFHHADYGRPLLWWWIDVIHILFLYTYQTLVAGESSVG